MNEDIEIRKLQVALYTRGVGVIIFAAWSTVKTLLYMFLNYGGSFSDLSDLGEYKWIVYTILFVILFLTCGIDMLIRVHIGRTAIAVSRGKKCGNGVLILAGLLTVISAAISVSSLWIVDSLSLAEIVVYYLADIVVDLILVEVIVFSVMLRKRMK